MVSPSLASNLVSHNKRVSLFRCILSFHETRNLKDYIELRSFSKLFRDLLRPPPAGWMAFPDSKYPTLKKLVDRINEVAKKDPSKAPSVLVVSNGVYSTSETRGGSGPEVDGYVHVFCSLTFVVYESRARITMKDVFKTVEDKEKDHVRHVGLETMTMSPPAAPRKLIKTWTIHNLGDLDPDLNLGSGEILTDGEFEFGGHSKWRWRLYPSGVSENVGDHMSLYLDCRDATPEHPAIERHIFRIIHPSSDRTKDFEQKSLPRKVHTDPDGWGWGKFVSHAKLRDEGFLSPENGTLTLELELTLEDAQDQIDAWFDDKNENELDARQELVQMPPPPTLHLRTVTLCPFRKLIKTWTIHNLDLNFGSGEILTDGEFEFGGHSKWRWRLYPSGVSENVGDHMSLYLDCRDATPEHPAIERHIFRIIHPSSDRTKDFEQKSLPRKVHTDPDGWGWGKFVSHAKLRDEGFLSPENGTLTLELKLHVRQELVQMPPPPTLHLCTVMQGNT